MQSKQRAPGEEIKHLCMDSMKGAFRKIILVMLFQFDFPRLPRGGGYKKLEVLLDETKTGVSETLCVFFFRFFRLQGVSMTRLQAFSGNLNNYHP